MRIKAMQIKLDSNFESQINSPIFLSEPDPHKPSKTRIVWIK